MSRSAVRWRCDRLCSILPSNVLYGIFLVGPTVEASISFLRLRSRCAWPHHCCVPNGLPSSVSVCNHVTTAMMTLSARDANCRAVSSPRRRRTIAKGGHGRGAKTAETHAIILADCHFLTECLSSPPPLRSDFNETAGPSHLGLMNDKGLFSPSLAKEKVQTHLFRLI